MKKLFVLILSLVLGLGLTACGGSDDNSAPDDVAGGDWRTTGVVRDQGSITRGGEDTDVLVCVHDADATFYYNQAEQTLYGSVDYPEALPGDPWEAFQSIDFADRNGDGDGDVSMLFTVEGETVLMVWFWDGEADAFVFQPEESQLPGSVQG